MTTSDLFAAAVRQLDAAGIDGPRRDVRLLLEHVSGEQWPLRRALAEDERHRFAALLARRAAREPLAYILGRKEFWSLDFDVGPGVLIPRPETETLVESLLDAIADRDAPLEILDIGTGSGCLLVASLHEFPRAEGVGIDVSGEALSWARRNVAKHGLEGRIQLAKKGWADEIHGRFDAIVTNPPYIRVGDVPALAPEVARYEPLAALGGGEDGLSAYRDLAPRIVHLLKPDGWLFAEVGKGQAKDVSALLESDGIETLRISPDLAGIPRCVVGRPRNRTH